jgi:thiol-disulfide isomerase/thioredoxin
VKNVLKLFLVVCVVLSVIRLLKPAVNFAHAPADIDVTRIAPDGTVVHEKLNPRLAPYLAVYHGAAWCGPCQRFSPTLAEFYRSTDRSKMKFQLVMVDYDRSDEEMLAYMRQHEMSFPAVRSGSAGSWGQATGNGIPNLMIVETATGKVIASSFNGDTFVGPEVPLEALKRIAR